MRNEPAWAAAVGHAQTGIDCSIGAAQAKDSDGEDQVPIVTTADPNRPSPNHVQPAFLTPLLLRTPPALNGNGASWRDLLPLIGSIGLGSGFNGPRLR